MRSGATPARDDLAADGGDVATRGRLLATRRWRGRATERFGHWKPILPARERDMMNLRPRPSRRLAFGNLYMPVQFPTTDSLACRRRRRV